MFKLVELDVPPSRPESTKGFPFKFEMGRKMVQDLGSFVDGFRDPTTHTSTPKPVEEVATKVMKANKVTELFQTMVIVSLNMGNLTLEVNTLKYKLDVREKEKAMFQEELDKEKKLEKGISIMWKYGGRALG
jgi:hypothetical protein